MRSLTIRMAALWALVAAAFGAAHWTGSRAFWFIFGCMGLVALFGSIGSLAASGAVHVVRKLPARPLQQGDALVVEGTARMPFRFPLAFVVIADEWVNEVNGHTVYGASLLMPWGRRTLPLSYRIPNLRRGIYRLRGGEWVSGDVMQLAGSRKIHGSGRRRKKTGSAAAASASASSSPGETAIYEAVVYPRPLTEIHWADIRREPAPLSDPAATRVREYAEGDSLRLIDWKSFLSRRKLMTKLYEPSDDRSVALLLDPGSDSEQFERAIRAASGFIERLTVEEAAEIRLHGHDEICTVKPDAGGREAAMRFLAVLRRHPSMNIADMLERLVPRPDSETVIATGKFSSGLLHAIDRAGRPQATTVLYASASSALTGAERPVVDALRRLGCSFGFVPCESGRRAGEGALIHEQA